MSIQNELGGQTAQQNAEHARQALARSDLAQALFHASSALATDPTNAEWRALVDQVIARAPDATVFVRPDEAKADFITAATRAYVYAAKGRFAEALVTVADVVAFRPDCAFLVWAREWMQNPQAVAQVDKPTLQKLLPLMLEFITGCPSPCPPEDPRRANCEAAVDVLGALYTPFPQEAFLMVALAAALRRAGRAEEGVRYAAYAMQLENNWSTSVALANAYRDAKHIDEAVQTFRYALSLRPDEPSPLLDIGDTLLDHNRIDEAVAAYTEVLQRVPEQPWARASIAYAKFAKSKSEADRDALYELFTTGPRARELWFRVVGDEPYFTWLPDAGDSTAFAARDIMQGLLRQPPPAGGLTINVPLTELEAPSALLAFHLFCNAQKYANTRIQPIVERVQTPDPRQPRGQVDFLLWAYDDKTPRPNPPPPDPRVQSAIAGIAVKPFCLPMWDQAVAALGAQMGPSWAQQIVCAMVHPPALPEAHRDPINWVARCQVAAALVIAHLEPAWENSQRRRTLFSLALGQTDWTVDAAVVALGWIARKDPNVRRDVESLFAQMERQLPRQGYTCWEYPLVCVWRNLGGHDAETGKRLDAWKKRCESDKVAFAEEKHGGLTLPQYAELAALRDAVLLKQGGGIGSALMAAAGQGAHPELASLCARFNIPVPQSAAAARIAEWDARINSDGAIEKRFIALKQQFELKLAGLDPNSHEGRVAQQIRNNAFDVESAKQNQMAAAQQMASGQGGDPDPVVFPGQKLARLSDYVGLMKGMQGGDMMGSLKKYGLDMGSYMQAAQAWGIKLASDPMLNAKFGEMMARR